MKRIFACIGFSFALALFAFNVFGVGFVTAASAVTAVVLLLSLLWEKTRREMFVPLCAGSALMAGLLFLFARHTLVMPQLALDGLQTDAVFYITDSGVRSGKGYTYSATVTQLFAGAPREMRVKLYSEKRILAECYELIGGKLQFSALADSGYASYGAWGKGVFLRASAENLQRTGEFAATPMKYIAALRQHLTEVFSATVGGDEGALGIGFLMGDRAHLSAQILQAFRITGTAHLTAVSGLHLGAVTGGFAFVFRKLGVKPKLYAPALILLMVFYAMLSGFSKSVVRAAIMMTVMLAGSACGKRSDALNSLGLALFLICLNPFAVCDIATLLTAACVLAIVGVYPVLAERIPKYSAPLSRRHAVRNILTDAGLRLLHALLLSASITVCTLPIMCLFFGYYSAVGIVLNTVIIPLGGIAVCVNMLAAALLGLGISGGVILLPVRLMNGCILKLVSACARVPYAGVPVGALFAVLLALVLVLLAAVNIVAFRYLKPAAVLLSAALIVASVCGAAYESRQPHIYVSPAGACVVCTADGTYICGVQSKKECAALEDYLGVRVRTVDCIIAKDEKCVRDMARRFDCKDIRIQSDSFEVTDGETRITCKDGTVQLVLRGVRFAQGDAVSGQNIAVTGDGVLYDARGRTRLKNGVIYTVGDGEYRVEDYRAGLLTS